MDPIQITPEEPQEETLEPPTLGDSHGLPMIIHLLDSAGMDVPDVGTMTELMQAFTTDKSLAVPVLWEGARPGDILISPSSSNAEGHIGICMSEGCQDIASFDEDDQQFSMNYTKAEWLSHFGGQQKLGAHLFRPQGDAAQQDLKLTTQQQANQKANMVEAMAPQIHAQAMAQGKQPSEEISKFLQSQGLSPNKEVLSRLDPPPKPVGPKPYRPKLN